MARRHTTTTKSEIERKLDLLEARFTAPPSTPQSSVEDSFLRDEDHSIATQKSSTPKTRNHRQGSQHSFTFDTPSLSGNSRSISARQKSTAPHPSALSIVEAATTKHLRKIAATAASEETTVLTVHAKNPLPTTPLNNGGINDVGNHAGAQSSSDSHQSRSGFLRTQQQSNQKLTPQALKENKRRKSVPVKRAQTSVKENTMPFRDRNRSSPRKKRSKPTKSLMDYFQRDGATTPKQTFLSPVDPSQTIDFWKQKCNTLEQDCRDKEQQLAALSNNRTILHTKLQRALSDREMELEEIKEKANGQKEKFASQLEEWVRSAAERDAVSERERLAADGARLGRIVRTGVRWQETWQDGHATKQLRRAKKQLSSKLLELKRRQQQVMSDGATQLEKMERNESIIYHIGRLRQEEKELEREEKRLNTEKTAHVRALKRIASEDSSRFCSRPKLNDRYVLQALLGKGGFSEVWKAYDLDEFREVAVKIHQLDPRWPESKKENYTKHVSREYEIHRNVRHPRIVSLFDVFEIDNNSFATVLEFCNGKDLDLLLKDKRRLSERDARAILLQILSGMNYLSHPSTGRQGIIHYDLKPGNILFDESGDAKITDFGLSKIVDTHDPADSMELTSQGAGTYWYLPPECFVLDETVRISNKVDVWSIGVIFFQSLFGKRPFGDGQSQDAIMADQTMLNAHQVKFPDGVHVSSQAKDFLSACLTYDQAFRPTIGQLCEHPYVVSPWSDVSPSQS